ncbi:MAG TPA: MBL fold metallo-hydrolase, partial [Mycobacteriales bacterium]|nr:MBL fold metallo-hydrolase [Mycobacteriales bacterium]
MTPTEIAPGVWRAGTRYVNWYVVDGGAEGLTLVDGGLPGYRSQLDSTLRHLGRTPGDVRALVLTHGHID